MPSVAAAMGALRGAWSPRPNTSNAAEAADGADAAFLLFAGRLQTGAARATAPDTVMAYADSVKYLLVSFVMTNLLSKMSEQLAAANYSASLHTALQAVRDYLHQPNQTQRNHSDLAVLHNTLTQKTAPALKGQPRQCRARRAQQMQAHDSSPERSPWPHAQPQQHAQYQPAASAASVQFSSVPGVPGPNLPAAPHMLHHLHPLCYPQGLQGHAAWPAPASGIAFMHPCQQNILPYATYAPCAPYALVPAVPAGIGAPQVPHLALSAFTSLSPTSLIGIACSNGPHTWSSFSQTGPPQQQLHQPLRCFDQHDTVFLNSGTPLQQPTAADAQGHQLPSCWTSSQQNEEGSSRIHIPNGQALRHAHPDYDELRGFS